MSLPRARVSPHATRTADALASFLASRPDALARVQSAFFGGIVSGVPRFAAPSVKVMRRQADREKLRLSDVLDYTVAAQRWVRAVGARAARRDSEQVALLSAEVRATYAPLVSDLHDTRLVTPHTYSLLAQIARVDESIRARATELGLPPMPELPETE